MRSILILLIVFGFGKAFSQVSLPLPTQLVQINDSLVQKLSSSEFYSVFTRKLYKDTISKQSFHYKVQVTHCPFCKGCLVVSKDSILLEKLSILNNKIEGIGTLYHKCVYPKLYIYPYCQALFKDGKLNGPAFFFDTEGTVTRVVLYKRGKYIKYLYHHNSLSRKSLRNANWYKEDPLKDNTTFSGGIE